MNTKLAAAIAVVAAFAITPALAQQKQEPANEPAQKEEPAAPKATKADIQKVVDGIKADKAKTTQFCKLVKLQDDFTAAAEKKDEKKLEALDKEMQDGAKKLGPDFEKYVMDSEMDEDASTVLDGLAKSCK
ncbi:hypothetical protein [Rhodomicrobium sp.]|jgi:hypothetical protein|uniref:hypothetical protein n=1 Tax=Rhodomicrobium sp. TaxID=2720632 RepID=UPI0039E2A9B6